MISHQYQSALTGLDLFVMLYIDNKQRIYNFADEAFEVLECPISDNHILVLPEMDCAPAYYMVSHDLGAEPQFLIVDICENIGLDPYGELEYRILTSSRFYYNGSVEVGDDYWQFIYDALNSGIAQLAALISQIQQGGGDASSEDLDKIYSIVQNIQSMIASSNRR